MDAVATVLSALAAGLLILAGYLLYRMIRWVVG